MRYKRLQLEELLPNDNEQVFNLTIEKEITSQSSSEDPGQQKLLHSLTSLSTHSTSVWDKQCIPSYSLKVWAN